MDTEDTPNSKPGKLFNIKHTHNITIYIYKLNILSYSNIKLKNNMDNN